MSVYTWFLYVDTGTGTTHIVAWDRDIREWLIPCSTIDLPPRNRVTYAPTKLLCQTCSKLTWQPSERDVPRART